MNGLDDVLARKHGIYRADFGERELGALAQAPEIRIDCEIVKVAVCDENAAAGYDEIGNVPRLFGNVKLSLFAGDAAWELVSEAGGSAGELVLYPETCSVCSRLIFPAAYLLPRWEFAPTAAGVHTMNIHFQLKSDPAGKIFYYQGQ